MSRKALRIIPARLPGVPATAEWLARNILLVGFITLLLLAGVLGYWSRKSIDALDEEIASIRQSEVNHATAVRGVAETAGKIQAYATMLLAYRDSSLLHFTARQNLDVLKTEMEKRLAKGRLTSLAATPEWQEFEAAFRAYWERINSQAPPEWSEDRQRMTDALAGLDRFIDEERLANDQKAHEVNLSGRNKVVAATIAVLVVGIIVAALTFREIRKVLKKLGKAYKETSESRDYLQSLLDSLVSGVIVVGQDGLVQTVSDSFHRLPIAGRADPFGKDVKEIFKDSPQLFQKVSTEIEKEEESSRYLGRFELGEGRLFDIFASPLVIAAEHRGLILVFLEVTETARAQSELRRNRALAAVGQMTAQIAHEIKNPLGSIRFATEVLKRQSSRGDLLDFETVEVIDRSVDHLATIVAELSEFARPKELNRSRLNLNDLIDDLVPMVADRLSEKQIEIRNSFASDLPAGSYDGTELRKLFLNLIINAIDASDPESSIEIRTRLNGHGEVFVDIEDHGKGMDEETLRRLFEPFYTTKEKGTGLGMAIAKKIAELHRGDLIVKSRKGKGTVATVRLPLS